PAPSAPGATPRHPDPHTDGDAPSAPPHGRHGPAPAAHADCRRPDCQASPAIAATDWRDAWRPAAPAGPCCAPPPDHSDADPWPAAPAAPAHPLHWKADAATDQSRRPAPSPAEPMPVTTRPAASDQVSAPPASQRSDRYGAPPGRYRRPPPRRRPHPGPRPGRWRLPPHPHPDIPPTPGPREDSDDR